MIEKLLPEKITWRDHLIGIGIAAAYVAWLVVTARSLGFARDEGFYFHAASDYARWYQQLFEKPGLAMERTSVDAIWTENHEHPSLMKTLMGFSWFYLHEKNKVFADASTAFRFPGMVMAGVAMWITYLFGARAYSRRAGAVAAVLLGLMPNVFYNAHLAAFDVPIMAMWAACIYVYWRSIKEGGLGWAIWAGVVYGLTLETKHNAWILPAVFLPHTIIANYTQVRRGMRRGNIPIPASLIAMATIGPAVFIALWPWMWNDTLPRLNEYVSFHMNHVYYNIEYLHKNYFNPPSPPSYAPVLIFATVPTITIVLFATGLVARARAAIERLRGAPADRAKTDLLFFLAFAAAIAVFFLPKTPIFGGTKHWLPAYPFLALFAGYGFECVACALETRLATFNLKPVVTVGAQLALIASVVIAPLAVTAHSHPYGLSAYVPFVGGTRGGANLGLNRQFWGFTTQSLDTYFRKNARAHSTVFIHDTAWDAWARMIDEKRIPPLQGTGSGSEAEFGIVHHELHMNEVDFQQWIAFETDAPDFVLTQDGVPIISVYRRRER